MRQRMEKKEVSELLTVREVARVLRVDATTVRRWVKVGTLEAVILPHVGKRQCYRITRKTVDTILGSHDMGQSLPKESEEVDLAEAIAVTILTH